MYEYKAKLIRAIDGDTVELLIDLGCDVHMYTAEEAQALMFQYIQLMGIDTDNENW